ncbi:MAG: lysylphosphatidylglycerol synthase domain-containing protein, partial [Bacilli bacterium]
MVIFFVISIGLGLMVSWITLRGDLVQFNWDLFIETSSEWLANWPMMAMAIFLLLLVILTSGLRLHLLLKNKVKKIRFLDSLYYGILARYYVLITPWGLGGQPILMGVMHQKKVPVGLATSAPMIDLLMMRFAMFVFVTIALVGFGDFVDPLIYAFAWVGFIVTCLIPVVMILASSHHRFRQLLVDMVSWLVPQKSKKSV